MKSEYDLSVIISARNEGELLSLTVQSIQAATRDIKAEIIVVDDASDLPLTISTSPSTIQTIRNVRREGAARSRQIGAKAAKGRYLCFPDGHMAFQRDHFARLLTALTNYPDAILGTALYDTASFDQFVASVTTGSLDHSGPCIFGYFLTTCPTVTVSPFLKSAMPEPYSVPLVGCMTLSLARELFLDLGGFEDLLVESGNAEDAELCLRSHAFGYAVLLVPTLRSLHYSSPQVVRKRELINKGLLTASAYYEGGAQNALRALYLHLPEKEISPTFERFRVQENLSFAPETVITEALRAKRRRIDARRIRSHEWVLSKACNQAL